MKPLRIGIDGCCWLNQRGYGRYTRNLLSALVQRNDPDRYYLFLDPETAEYELPEEFTRVVVPTRRPPAQAASAEGRRDLSDLCRMSAAVARYPLDVFFFPSVYTFFPLLRPVRTLVAIHDVIAEHHPELVFARRHLALFWRAKLAIARRQASLVLTVSDHARSGILDHFHLPEQRVRVILEAPDPIFRPLASPRDPADILPTCSLPHGCRYLLYVGGLSPHKNLPVLIEAYRHLIAGGEFEKLHLMLVGDYTRDVFLSSYQELRALVTRHGLDERVHFTGFVPDPVLVELYNYADLLILPSLEEGFGLPVIEAAACGTPVIASEGGPAASLLGSAVCTFPARDVNALVESLRRCLSDPARRHGMGKEGQRRAAAFTWEQAADQLHPMLRQLAAA